ncbi:MAG: DUF4845 domain-containing protein [Candidatus Tectomicrobia bacterium]|uniref:DUF4845 domain-containing protein n=1 Tax=Tectimicrobiota bacterium TaxID=2528274 RepID=A0A937VWY3_UNCTE|nr:DUF4845 domain-containing protein [Candidatus Tectomicrobia bacterium]
MRSAPDHGEEGHMHVAQRQAGLTFLGLLIILVPFALIGYVIMNAAPAYIEAFNVGDAVTSLRKDIDLRERSRDEIYTILKKRLDVNDIKNVAKEDVTIQKTVNSTTVNVDYEVKVPLFGNIALALSFHKSVVLR